MRTVRTLLIALAIVVLAFAVLLFSFICYRRIICTASIVVHPSIRVIQTSNGYKVFFLKGKHIDGSMRFSADDELIRNWKIEAINEENAADFLGKDLEEIAEAYGPPHADVGSGFNYPAYVSKNAQLIVLYTDDHIVSKVVVKDLIANNLLWEYE